MKNLIKSVLFYTFMLWLSTFGSPAVSQADCSYATGGSTAQAKVSFRIVIPPSLYLQVLSFPSDSIQSRMLIKNTSETGKQAGEMILFDTQPYENVPKKRTMTFFSNGSHSTGKIPGNPYTNHRGYLWMPSGIIKTSNNMKNGTLMFSRPSKGIYTYHFSDKISSFGDSPGKYQSLILCSP